ncbi:MAG: SMC-Scp complex subunit ScpB, partial [Sphaerospermopsis kisseleviana]
ILQSELIELRGSGVYQHVPELVGLGFVRKRRDNESRSYSLQVTSKFHQYFQIDQLPEIIPKTDKEQQLELELEVTGDG